MSYAIPTASQHETIYADICRRASEHRARGSLIIVVQGLGYVGLAVAAVASACRRSDGSLRNFVIGVDLPSPGAYYKVAEVNLGTCPIESPDPALAEMIRDGALTQRNLVATSCEQVFSLADVVVIDIPLDARRTIAGDGSVVIDVDLASFERGIRAVGKHMNPEALVLVETTVPVGACEQVVAPALREELRNRGHAGEPKIAHSYERVMPGPRYTESIRNIWRSYSATSEAAAESARAFLETIVKTEQYPLTGLSSTVASELAKLLENSYRAVNIALLYEWTLLAEELGIDLFAVVDSIRVRKGTHDNMRYPGFGVGGYCLTKDSLLAQWGAQTFYGSRLSLELSLRALEINERMPLHAFGLLKQMFGGGLAGRAVLIAGVSYLPDLDDTRNSPSLVLASALQADGAQILAHDPVVKQWPECPDASFISELPSALECADGVVWCVQHRLYRELAAPNFLTLTRIPEAVVDANNVLSDVLASDLARRGIRLAGVGKGHWRAQRYHLSKRQA